MSNTDGYRLSCGGRSPSITDRRSCPKAQHQTSTAEKCTRETSQQKHDNVKVTVGVLYIAMGQHSSVCEGAADVSFGAADIGDEVLGRVQVE